MILLAISGVVLNHVSNPHAERLVLKSIPDLFTNQSKQVNRGCSAIHLLLSWLRVMQVCSTLVLLHFAVLLVSMEGKHEPQAVVRFLASTGATPIQIWRQLQAGYHVGSMSQKTVRKWCRRFSSGETSIKDKPRPGRA